MREEYDFSKMTSRPKICPVSRELTTGYRCKNCFFKLDTRRWCTQVEDVDE